MGALYDRMTILDSSALLDFCRSEQAWALETLEALVRLESPSDDKAAVDRCGAELERRLGAMDARITGVRQSASGDHIRASFGEGASPRVLALAHFDTVWPVGTLNRMPLRRDAGRLYGPGVYDMKGGIVIALLAVRALGAVAPGLLPHVVLLLTTDEETGSTTSKTLIEQEAAQSEAVLVFEPSLGERGALKTARKGCATFELRVRGIAAHSGEPDKGVSAVLELAGQLLAIERLQIGEHVSITACMTGGGTRANVVPDEAWALFDVRVPTLEAAARVERALRELRPHRTGARLEVSGGLERPPLERTPGVVRLFEMARAVAAEVGVELGEGRSGGVSDGNFTAALGVPTLDGVGAVGGGAHAADEHIVIDQLALRAAVVAGLLARLARANI
jgi:glutamate carboxypeptidase